MMASGICLFDPQTKMKKTYSSVTISYICIFLTGGKTYCIWLFLMLFLFSLLFQTFSTIIDPLLPPPDALNKVFICIIWFCLDFIAFLWLTEISRISNVTLQKY